MTPPAHDPLKVPLKLRNRICRYQRDPAVVVWPSGFLEAWGTKAKKPHTVQKQVVNGLAAFGATALRDEEEASERAKPFQKVGASPPTFWNGLWGRRGRPDPRNRRCPAGPKTMY